MDAGDVMGHEPMGVVEEVGAAETGDLRLLGDRVVIPFQDLRGHLLPCVTRRSTPNARRTQVRGEGL